MERHLGPRCDPQNVVDTLVKGINDVLPAARPCGRIAGVPPAWTSTAAKPADMDKRMKDDIVKWSAVIEKAGIPKRD